MIGKFAEKFGLHPDHVFYFSRFDTVTAFIVDWKEEREFEDRYSEIEKSLQPKK